MAPEDLVVPLGSSNEPSQLLDILLPRLSPKHLLSALVTENEVLQQQARDSQEGLAEKAAPGTPCNFQGRLSPEDQKALYKM